MGFSLIFVDTRTKSVKLRGKSQHLEDTEKKVTDVLSKEREFLCCLERIKQKKGVAAYLMYLSELQEVQYPSYWKCTESGSVVQEQLDPQSELFKEVEKMVLCTWEAGKVGSGRDAVGLQYTKLVVKNIFHIQNRQLFAMYYAMRKPICGEAAVNQFPSLNGLQGEWEVKTKTLGMLTSSNVLFCTQ